MRRALLLAGGIAILGCSSTPESSAAQQSPVNTSATVSASRRNAITNSVASVSPAVVTVQTQTVERVPVDPLEAFFGGASGQRVSPGLGTGFVTRSDGVILTNAHVVAGATGVSVMMRDGKIYPAKVLGSDETNDIAVLKIDAKDLPVVKLGNSDNLLVGEWAVAIGNPYGFLLGNPEPSVSVGVVSAVGRNLVGPSEGAAAYFDMIQTDAAINPGNSGGPLIDADGEVIGVNSSIYSTTGGSIGLGFAIPINRAARVMDDLLTHGAVRRPWVGIKLRQISTQNPRDVLTTGAVVGTVVPGSPAAKAGINPGDVIEQLGTRPIRNAYDWEAALLNLRVGQSVQLRVREGNSVRTVTTTVGDLPEVTAPKVQVLRELELTTVTPQIRADRGIRSRAGALITNVSDRVASELGIQPGDVIVQINRTPVATADDAAKALDYYGGRGPIRMFLERSGQIFITDFAIR